MFCYFILSALIVAASGQVVTPGNCDPNVQVQQNFNVEAYTGLWYELNRYELIPQIGGECVTADYTAEDGGVQVFNRMVRRGKLVTILGRAEPAPDAAGSGKLIVTFPTIGRSSPYWVLSTDYETYSLVYTCINAADKKLISSWILSRTKTLSPEVFEKINKTIEATDGLDWPTYRTTDQSEEACKITSL